jgi:hypothetical protein
VIPSLWARRMYFASTAQGRSGWVKVDCVAADSDIGRDAVGSRQGITLKKDQPRAFGHRLTVCESMLASADE